MIDWLAELVDPLNAVLFTLGGDQVSTAELLGFVTGGLCVALTVRRSILNFPVGIANCVFFLVLFVSAQLWAGATLQLLYIGLGAIGWWQWHSGRTDDAPVPVRRSHWRVLVGCVVFVALGTWALSEILTAVDGSAPLWDALTTCLALTAQWLLNTRRIETWFFWIAADCIYIPLYLSQGLNLTAAVYVLFLGLCILGLRAWTQARVPLAESVSR